MLPGKDRQVQLQPHLHACGTKVAHNSSQQRCCSRQVFFPVAGSTRNTEKSDSLPGIVFVHNFRGKTVLPRKKKNGQDNGTAAKHNFKTN
jgi:hypothetical protein